MISSSKRKSLLCLLISLIKVSNIVRSFAFVPKSLSFEVPSLTCGRRKGGTKLSAKDTSPSFSEESLTTRISPTTRFGPFGSGGTVVGFSKYPGVRRAFEENFAQRLELGSQLVVYMEGEKVVDLYGFAPETIVDGKTKKLRRRHLAGGRFEREKHGGHCRGHAC